MQPSDQAEGAEEEEEEDEEEEIEVKVSSRRPFGTQRDDATTCASWANAFARAHRSERRRTILASLPPTKPVTATRATMSSTSK